MTEILDTVVIGAGWAGVCAARDLKDRGEKVVILEASDHVGGRTFGRTFPGLNVHADLGGAWINRDIQPLMRREVARYGVPLKLDKPAQSVAFRIGGVVRPLPVPAAQLGDLERAMTHLATASKRIAPSRSVLNQSLADLDVSADEFFAPLNLPEETLEFIHAMLPMYTGAHMSRCSMLNIVVQAAAFGQSAFGFYDALTERFVYGPESLLKAIVEQDCLDLRLSTKVARIEQTDDQVTVRTVDGERFEARTCIVAIPTNVIRHVEFGPELSADKQAALATNHVGRCHKIIIHARNLPKHPFACGTGAIQSLITSTENADGTSVLIAFASEDIEPIDPTDLGQVEKAVQSFYPDAEVIATESHNWNEDPLFDGTWRWDLPGRALDFIRVMNQPEGRVVFAGTDIDDSVWRTWMEGALNSSQQAVNAVSVMLRDGVPQKG
jgi:monoamine oxidase